MSRTHSRCLGQRKISSHTRHGAQSIHSESQQWQKGSGSVSPERPTHPSVRERPVYFGSERDTSPRAWDTNSLAFAPRTKQRDRKRRKLKRHRWLLRGEEEERSRSPCSGRRCRGRRSGARAAGAGSSSRGSSKASCGPSSSTRRGRRSRRLCRSSRPVRVVRLASRARTAPRQHPQAQKRPSLKCRRRPSQRFLDFTLGDLKGSCVSPRGGPMLAGGRASL